jgi:hypothetical protein
MSTFEDSRYRWRETYFVLFDARRRPTLKRTADALKSLNKRFQLSNSNDDGRGRIDSLTLISPDDFAALDICYTEGEEVLEQTAALVEDLKKLKVEPPRSITWEQLRGYDGRFDVLHFEQVVEESDEDADEEILDPGALLLVLDALAKLTGGVAIDPQAGTFLTE